jgi:hypothetical protein
LEDIIKIDAALCSRFLLEAFRADLSDCHEVMLKIVEMHAVAMDIASNPLKVQLIKNISASRVNCKSAIQCLIITLSNQSKTVVSAAIEALAEFGVSCSDDLEDEMNAFQMFTDVILVPKEKFIHPLDVRK